MRIGSELAAFRQSRAAQNAAQAVMIQAAADWRAGRLAAPVLADLDGYGAGESLDHKPALSGLFTDCGAAPIAAQELVQGFLAQASHSMTLAPLGQPCFRHSCEGGYTLIHLANAGRATLSIVAVEADGTAERAIPDSATFTAAERHEAVLAGHARGAIAALEGKRVQRTGRVFAPGNIWHLPAWTTRVFHRVDASLVCLRLARTPERMPATRQVSLTDGSVLHQAAGDPRDTRHELMGALLAAMERDDAAPVLARMAQSDGHGPTRWQAMKSALALDTAAGFAALSAMAADDTDPLHSDAAALRAMLIARHPVLSDMEQA